MDFWIILFLSKHANITQDKEWDVCESTTIGMSQTFISVLPVSLMKKKFYTSAILLAVSFRSNQLAVSVSGGIE